MAAVNVLYKVGARNEDYDRTGFAHLFEHLMFGGSAHIPSYDEPVQLAGGENNAFTNNDYTNYYLALPKENIETALWLESDRMLSLAFNEKSLEVQRKVVVEEFAQRYLNQPYGDIWLLLRPLAYERHPYRWATIGRDIEHIRSATMDQVRAFFDRYYKPGNAILSIAGDIPAPAFSSWPKNGSDRFRQANPSGTTSRRNRNRPRPGGWRYAGRYRPRSFTSLSTWGHGSAAKPRCATSCRTSSATALRAASISGWSRNGRCFPT